MNDPLFFNKLGFSVLAALLLFFGLPLMANALVGGGHHAGGVLHLAYPIAFETTTAATQKVPKADLGTLLANATVAGGERRAAICASCHSFEKGGRNGTGPNLWNLIGRDIASVSGFGYSSALQAVDGGWTYEKLDAYLKNSQEYAPGTNMNQRFPKAEQRADLLAYLASMSDNPVAFPEPETFEASAQE